MVNVATHYFFFSFFSLFFLGFFFAIFFHHLFILFLTFLSEFKAKYCFTTLAVFDPLLMVLYVMGGI